MITVVKLIGKMGIYLIWGVSDLFNLRSICDSLYEKINRKSEYRIAWMIYFLVITAAFCLFKNYDTKVLRKTLLDTYEQEVFYLLFYVRLLPMLIFRYGWRIRAFITLLLYKESITVITISAIYIYPRPLDNIWAKDGISLIVSVVFLALVKISDRLKSEGRGHHYFMDLEPFDAVLILMISLVIRSIESGLLIGEEGYGIFPISVIYDSYLPVKVLLLLVLILIIRTIVSSKRRLSMENVVVLLRDEVMDFSAYYDELNHNNENVRKMVHDTKNHMYAIRSMITGNNNAEALEYIDRLTGTETAIRGKYSTGNSLADAILDRKSQESEKYDTVIDFAGIVPKTGVDNMDMVILLSNMLDNAIDACRKISSESRITVKSEIKGDLWILTVVNPVRSHINVSRGLPSTKGANGTHGYGIANMREVTDKYNGALSFYCEDKMFMVIASLKF